MLARVPPTICWSALACVNPIATAVVARPAASRSRMTREVAPMCRLLSVGCLSTLPSPCGAGQLDHVPQPGELGAIRHPGAVAFPRRFVVLAAAVLVAGCSSTPQAPPPVSSSESSGSSGSSRTSAPSVSSAAPTTSASVAPEWTVGATPLPLRPDGFGQILPTPPELVNRSLPDRRPAAPAGRRPVRDDSLIGPGRRARAEHLAAVLSGVRGGTAVPDDVVLGI